MNKQWVDEWEQLLVVQRELVAEYLRLLSGPDSPASLDALASVRLLLSRVSGTVETFRKHLPP